MNQRRDRELRLKKLMEREIDQDSLQAVHGGRVKTRPGQSRYCALCVPE